MSTKFLVRTKAGELHTVKADFACVGDDGVLFLKSLVGDASGNCSLCAAYREWSFCYQDGFVDENKGE